MVRDDERRALRDGLVRDGGGVIDGHEHARDLRVRIPDEQPDVVPARGVAERRERVEDAQRVRELHSLNQSLIWLIRRRDRSWIGTASGRFDDAAASSSACRCARRSPSLSTTPACAASVWWNAS